MPDKQPPATPTLDGGSDEISISMEEFNEAMGATQPAAEDPPVGEPDAPQPTPEEIEAHQIAQEMQPVDDLVPLDEIPDDEPEQPKAKAKAEDWEDNDFWKDAEPPDEASEKMVIDKVMERLDRIEAEFAQVRAGDDTPPPNAPDNWEDMDGIERIDFLRDMLQSTNNLLQEQIQKKQIEEKAIQRFSIYEDVEACAKAAGIPKEMQKEYCTKLITAINRFSAGAPSEIKYLGRLIAKDMRSTTPAVFRDGSAANGSRTRPKSTQPLGSRGAPAGTRRKQESPKHGSEEWFEEAVRTLTGG